MPLAHAAAILECDVSKLSRIETGERGIRPKELRELLREYEAREETIEVLLRISDAKGPWRQFTGVLPDGVLSRMAVESCATDVSIFEAQHVPAILQIPEYADALADADPAYAFGPYDEHDLDVHGERTMYFAGNAIALGEATEVWQSALDMTAITYSVVLSAAALLNRVGSAQVMRDQLSRIADPPEGVTVQITPYPLDDHPAPWAGSLAVFEFGHSTGVPRVACVGSPTGPLFLEEQADTDICRRVLTRLQGMALRTAEQEALLNGLLHR
jgi:hypothetical protein